MFSLQDGGWSDGAQGSKAFSNYSPQTPSGLKRESGHLHWFHHGLRAFPASLCNGSMKGCSPSPRVPSQGAPSTRAGSAARGANPGKVQGDVSHAQPAAWHASPTLPRAQTPALTRPQQTSPSS